MAAISRHPAGRTGLPPGWIVGLAALGVPRAVVHDLEPGASALQAALGVGVVVVWILVGWGRARDPLRALLWVGLAYGLMLAVTHQVLWHEAFDGAPPRLGGGLADAPDWVHAVATRTGAFLGSVATGAALGAVAGLLARLLRSTVGGGGCG
jgi:hypothetical protein